MSTATASPRVLPGVQRLLDGAAPHLRGLRLGLVCHPASVTPALRPSVDALMDAGFHMDALFGPQHGARGEKQDNMIESEHDTDSRTGLPVHSLYSETRKPTPEMLEGLDVLIFDLQDVGVRVYTFVWTMALAMEACADAGVAFVVLDRPNPVGGVVREGPVLREGFESFVGLHPVPLRHGLTAGELARWLVAERGIGCELEVIPCEGWSREMRWRDTGLPWVMPSPNLPTPDSCQVYPGMVLLEGTNLSEGRGTTRPFELFGAPWLDGYALLEALGSDAGGEGDRAVRGSRTAGADHPDLAGVHLRPCWFEATFQKHAGRVCGGAQLHVTDPEAFRPVRTAVALLRAAREVAPDHFGWRAPPYEYEEELMPIDILWGHDGLRTGLDRGLTVDAILEGVDGEAEEFGRAVEPYLLYE